MPQVVGVTSPTGPAPASDRGSTLTISLQVQWIHMNNIVEVGSWEKRVAGSDAEIVGREGGAV